MRVCCPKRRWVWEEQNEVNKLQRTWGTGRSQRLYLRQGIQSIWVGGPGLDRWGSMQAGQPTLGIRVSGSGVNSFLHCHGLPHWQKVSPVGSSTWKLGGRASSIHGVTLLPVIQLTKRHPQKGSQSGSSVAVSINTTGAGSANTAVLAATGLAQLQTIVVLKKERSQYGTILATLEALQWPEILEENHANSQKQEFLTKDDYKRISQACRGKSRKAKIRNEMQVAINIEGNEKRFSKYMQMEEDDQQRNMSINRCNMR